MIREMAAVFFGGTLAIGACWGCGRAILTFLAVNLSRAERALVGFVAGAALVSVGIFLLATLGVVYRPVLVGVGLVAIAGGSVVRSRKSLPQLTPLRPTWRWLFLALFVPFSGLYFMQAMGPEYSADGSGYHLGYVVRYLQTGGFRHIQPAVYGSLSQGLEMIYLMAFAIGRHSAAALVHFGFLVALALGMVCYGRRFGMAPAGICAGLLVYLSPVFGGDGTAAYNDVAAGCVIFFLFYLLQLWDDQRSGGLLVLAGMLAGFAYAIKYTAFPAALYAVAFVWWRSRRMRPAALVAACALAMIVPWMMKDRVMAGNPLSPFFNRWFPNPYTSVAFEQDYRHGNGIHRDGFSWSGSVTDVTMRGHLSRSLLGPVFLLAPLALASLIWQQGRRLLAAALVFAIPWLANVDTRMLIPSAIFVALALGLVLARVPFAIPAVLAAHAVLSWPTVARLYADPLAMRVQHFLPREALRIVPEEATLRYRLPGYRVARMIEEQTPPGARVFSFGPMPIAYTTRDVLVYWESSFNEAIKDVLLMPLRPEMQPRWRLRFEFPRRTLRGVRVVQTAGDPGSQWSIGEIRVAAAGGVHTSANPWDAGWAWDGKPLTRWRSLEPARPGMHIDLRFDQPSAIDAVEIDCAHDQWGVRLRLEDEAGAVLAEAPRPSEGPPLPDLRAAAVQEIRGRGITHLLLRDSDFGAQDFRDRADEWGLAVLGEEEGWRLYALR